MQLSAERRAELSSAVLLSKFIKYEHAEYEHAEREREDTLRSFFYQV